MFILAPQAFSCGEAFIRYAVRLCASSAPEPSTGWSRPGASVGQIGSDVLLHGRGDSLRHLGAAGAVTEDCALSAVLLVQRWELAAGMVELEAGKASADKRLAEIAQAQVAWPAGCNYNYGQKIGIVTAIVCVSRRTSLTAPNQGKAMHTTEETPWPSESTPLGWMA